MWNRKAVIVLLTVGLKKEPKPSGGRFWFIEFGLSNYATKSNRCWYIKICWEGWFS